MTANTALALLMMQQEKRNGWDPNDWDGEPLAIMVFLLIAMVALATVWVLS